MSNIPFINNPNNTVYITNLYLLIPCNVFIIMVYTPPNSAVYTNAL